MQQLTKEVKARGYQYFDWNVIANDAIQQTVNKQTVINAVLKGVQSKNNAVILFQESPVKTTTTEALPTIIQEPRTKKKRVSSSKPSIRI